MPNGAIPLPREADLDAFREALLTFFGGRVAILALHVEAILSTDRLEEREGDPDGPVEDPSFWALRRTEEDESEHVPLFGARLSRLPG